MSIKKSWILLYTAEYYWSFLPGAGDTYMGVADAQYYIDSIIDSEWWQNRCPVRDVKVTTSKNPLWFYADRTSYRKGFVQIPAGRAYIPQSLLIHELAHIFIVEPKDDIHGKVFIDAHLALMGHFISPKSSKLLRDAYIHFDVLKEDK